MSEAESKLEVSVAGLTFSGTGNAEWLSAELEKVLKAAPELAKAAPPPITAGAVSGAFGTASANGGAVTTLAEHLKTRQAGSNQTRRFLATADWLRLKDQELTTAAVTAALRDNHQPKLSNPAQCLNNNVSQGFCEKNGKSFFIAPAGLKELGH
jgi:hypothetical protein